MLNSLHPLAKQQLDEATGSTGDIDVERLLAAVSACYEASSALAEDVLDAALSEDQSSVTAMASATAGGGFAWDAIPNTLFDILGDGVLLVDGNNTVRLINHVAFRLLGEIACCPRASIVGQQADELLGRLYPRHASPDVVDYQTFATNPSSRRDGVSLVCDLVDGTPVQVSFRLFADGQAGTASSCAILLRPRESTSEQERQLRVVEEEYRNLFDNALIGIYRSTIDGRQLRANPALVHLNGYDSEDELLRAVNDIADEWYVNPSRREDFIEEMNLHGRVTDFVSEVYRHKSRERIWVSENAWLVRDDEGNPLFFEGTVVDATVRIEAEAEINHLAHHDHLTGLPNRLMLLKRLREALLQPQTASSVAVHCLDLDHFKDVNDTLGHQAGDQLLIEVGKRLRASIKSTDVLARLGGDEFTILQFGVRSPADMEALAGRIVRTLNKPFWIDENQVNVGVSVGVAPYARQEPAAFLRDADIALYEAKKNGRQTFVVYSSDMGEALQERRALEEDLRQAIEEGGFDLFLQPIINSETEEAVVYEALLRWHHPTRGLVSPSRFVPLAEEASMMIALGDWVLNETMAAAAYLPEGRRIAMNLSPLQLRDPGFVDRVGKAMERFDVTPDQIELEITETVIMSDDELTVGALGRLREMGLRLALDDFGTGHASLSYLQRFRFDKIKIDQSFVRRMVDDPISAAVVRAVTSLGADLGAVVVAEGVESTAQFEALKREGCTFYQGYLFAQPQPWSQVLVGDADLKLSIG
ncbi:MAG: putative bifunctional diguanylate cyclase/phosphodiesterase [Cohaesibacteraceae bacterium]